MAEEKVETAVKKTPFEIIEENFDKLKRILIRINSIISEYENPLGWDESEFKEKQWSPELRVARERLVKEFKSLTNLGIEDPESYIRLRSKFPSGWINCASYIIYRITNKTPEWIWDMYDKSTHKKYLQRFDEIKQKYIISVKRFIDIVNILSKEHQDSKKFLERERKRQERQIKNRIQRNLRKFNYFRFDMILIMDPTFIHDVENMSKYCDDIQPLEDKYIRALKYARYKYLKNLSDEERQDYYDYCRRMSNNVTEDPSSIKVVYHTAYVKNNSLRKRELSKVKTELTVDDEFDILESLDYNQTRIYEDLMKRYK